MAGRPVFALPHAGGFREGLTSALNDLLNRGHDCLADTPSRIVRNFANIVDGMDGHPGLHITTALPLDMWQKFLELHDKALRELTQSSASSSSATSTSGSSSKKPRKVEILLSSVLFLFIKSSALKAGTKFGNLLAYALIETGAFHFYAKLSHEWSVTSINELEPKLRLIAQFSLIFSSCAQLTVSDLRLHPTDLHGTALYEACLRALSSSQLLEHMTRALLTALRAAHDAAASGGLAPDQERNIRTGVTETCGCIVSALHGIAGKQGMLESSCASSEADAQPVVQDIGKRLLPLVREVLSGPCLQFMLGREIVASRLRITGGEGPTYGLDDAMLPELKGPDRALRTGALTDRLLSRLGAASLVWHLVIPDRQGPGAAGPAAAAQPEVPVLLYRMVNIFDMVLEALAAVVGPDTQVEHLPGASQLTLVEPAMLLVRLTLRMKRKRVVERLGRLWEVLVELLKRPDVRLQYSEHRPLQLIGGLLRLELQMAPPQAGGAQGGVPAAAHDGAAPAHINEVAAHQGPGCSFNLRCALNAGFLRAVEKLLRGWARSDASIKGETSCLCTVNHLLRWPCVWTAVLAHGSVQEVASLIVTLRRLGELFKDRGFEAMSRAGNNDPNEHQDAEVVVTAYMAALLEQQAVVLLPPAGDRPLALNDALEAGGLPVFADAVDQLGGRPAPDSEAAQQQAALAVFAMSQWLPNAVWLARVVDTWFSVEMGKAVLRWVLEAALQCLVARDRSDAERAAAQPELSEGELREAGASSSGDSAAGPSSGRQEAPSRPCGSGAVTYVAWVTFLMMGVDFLAWINKYLAQLREVEADRQEPAMERRAALEGTGAEVEGRDVGVGGAEADASQRLGGATKGSAAGSEAGSSTADGPSGPRGSDRGESSGMAPEALLPAVLNILEVMTVAVSRSVQACVSRPRSMASALEAPMAEISRGAGAATTAGGSAAAAADGAKAEPRTSVSAQAAAPEACADASGRAADHADSSDTSSSARTTLDRDIVLDEWFRGVLLREGRQGLLSVLEAWADGKEQGDGGAAASDVPPSGATPEQRTPQLAALREEVERKHDIANLRDLPSPYAAAELVEHKAKIKLCANPGCTNLEGDSEADLAGRKTCRFCQAVSYCSSNCQLEHWNSQHRSECAGAPSVGQALCPRGRTRELQMPPPQAGGAQGGARAAVEANVRTTAADVAAEALARGADGVDAAGAAPDVEAAAVAAAPAEMVAGVAAEAAQGNVVAAPHVGPEERRVGGADEPRHGARTGSATASAAPSGVSAGQPARLTAPAAQVGLRAGPVAAADELAAFPCADWLEGACGIANMNPAAREYGPARENPATASAGTAPSGVSAGQPERLTAPAAQHRSECEGAMERKGTGPGPSGLRADVYLL